MAQITSADTNIFFSFSRIGLCGFDNPMRDSKTDEIKHQVGQVINEFINFEFITQKKRERRTCLPAVRANHLSIQF